MRSASRQLFVAAGRRDFPTINTQQKAADFKSSPGQKRFHNHVSV